MYSSSARFVWEEFATSCSFLWDELQWESPLDRRPEAEIYSSCAWVHVMPLRYNIGSVRKVVRKNCTCARRHETLTHWKNWMLEFWVRPIITRVSVRAASEQYENENTWNSVFYCCEHCFCNSRRVLVRYVYCAMDGLDGWRAPGAIHLTSMVPDSGTVSNM